VAGRPMKRLQARTLKRVRQWLLVEEKPLSFVLNELGITLRRWEEIVSNDQPLRDVLDLVRLREQEMIVETLKTSNQHKVTAAIFLAKAKHGFTEAKAAPVQNAPALNVTVMLPQPARSAEEWNRIIDVTPEPLVIEHKADGQ